MVSNLDKRLENSMNKKYEKGIDISVDSTIIILELLKENKSTSEISKITGIKEDKIKEIASLFSN